MKKSKRSALRKAAAAGLAVMLFLLCGVTAMGARFNDVSSSAYYYEAVNWAVDTGITTGASSASFAPNQTCTRAQMVSFLWRAVGKPKPKAGTKAFSDVSPSAYYYDAVMWAAGSGITMGAADGRFDPDGYCTRAQAVSLIHRMLGEPEPAANSVFSDVSSGAYYYNAVMWASGEGITRGVSKNRFSPDTVCTRAEIITFLYRSYNMFMG